jgi:endonuclease/exonuclease/phosphatase family metal-dependent hydrolase
VRRLAYSFQLILVIVALVACGGSSSSPTQPSGPEFRVMTFNIAHGLNAKGEYDLKWTVDTIAKVQPDLVGLQELTRNHPYYQCQDQPAKIAEGLTERTGRRWSAVYHQEWFTPNVECQSSGRGDGRETEGLGFFAPEPLAPPTTTQLWNGRIGLLVPLHRGRDIPIVVTHLAHGAQGFSDRMRQLDALLPWVNSQPGGNSRVLIGDFNLLPDGEEYQKIRGAGYRDAWLDAVAAGTARGRADGITHKTVRIDYIFYSGDALELLWVDTIDTRTLIGVEASDHRPVVAAFRVR